MVKRAAEPIPAWAKADGHRRKHRARAVDACSGTWVVASEEWSVTQSREGLVVARPVVQAASKARGGDETGGSGRSSDDTEGQHNPGEQRTRGVATCFWRRGPAPTCLAMSQANGYQRSCSRGGASDTSNRQGPPPGRTCREETVRSRYLEAVLGKTRRTEFQRGQRKRSHGTC